MNSPVTQCQAMRCNAMHTSRQSTVQVVMQRNVNRCNVTQKMHQKVLHVFAILVRDCVPNWHGIAIALVRHHVAWPFRGIEECEKWAVEKENVV